jgi:hypothetical protein
MEAGTQSFKQDELQFPLSPQRGAEGLNNKRAVFDEERTGFEGLRPFGAQERYPDRPGCFALQAV